MTLPGLRSRGGLRLRHDLYPRAGPLRFIGIALGVAWTALPFLTFAQGLDDNESTRRVVILNATDPYLPAFVALDSGLRAAVRENSPGAVELYAETLDMHRFQRKLLDRDLVALLQRKYRDLRIDVVVTLAPLALDFAQRHRNDIWNGATIVFNSLSSESLAERKLGPDVIGLPHRLALGQTLDLALRLRPGTRRIAVVGGTSGECCEYLALARQALQPLEGRIDVEYLVDLGVAETVAAVRALPPDAVVLYLTIFRDGDGQPQVPRDVLERISAVSPVPIFGVFETYLGHGIVAGEIASYEAQGRETGQLVARVLNGEEPATIGIQPPVSSDCMADWRQLRRWNIDADRLPADCEIRFRDPTLWDQYYRQVLVVLAVILAQAALIVALMLKHRRLRQARGVLVEECARRSSAEALAAQLRGRLARFSKERSLGAMSVAIAHEINQPLIAIQNYAQAAKRRLQGDAEDKPKLLELFAKIEGQAERAGTITQRVRSLVSSDAPRLQPVSLCPLLEAVIRMLEPELESRGCRITCLLTGEAPTVLADPLQVQLVLVNLLHNAAGNPCTGAENAKHVSIDIRHGHDREVEVSVTDHGPGVPPEHAENIFEPLYSSRPGGMGMGLAISRAIIEAHGGRLWHEPNPAGGAIFRFTLRAAQA